jgi:hypothetical protein
MTATALPDPACPTQGSAGPVRPRASRRPSRHAAPGKGGKEMKMMEITYTKK